MKEKETENDYFEVAPGVWGLKDLFVNVYMVQNEEDYSWVLIDAGLKTSYSKIKKAAEKIFGEQNYPVAIILTHGHFDHVGSLVKLADWWQVPVYAHYLEMPYLTGKSSYPPADSSVGGGLFAYIADLYPNEPIDIRGRVKALPRNSSVPGLPEWRYIHTPGHAPGHISFWHEKDKILIAGDAFVTTQQESAIAVILQSEIISGPPKYFTYDWTKAEKSVKELADLEPEIIATGHGKPMMGREMQQELEELAEEFKQKAVPKHGRYVNNPAVADKTGVVYLPEREFDPYGVIVQISGIAAILALGWVWLTLNKNSNKLAVS